MLHCCCPPQASDGKQRAGLVIPRLGVQSKKSLLLRVQTDTVRQLLLPLQRTCSTAAAGIGQALSHSRSLGDRTSLRWFHR